MNSNILYSACLALNESDFEQYIKQNKASITLDMIYSFASILGGSKIDQECTRKVVLEWLV